MEYVQMTLNDWLDMKQKLKLELQGVKQSFVRIGYVLRKIDDQKLYEQDGYKSIAEFAKAEYGLEASTVSRFMSINKEYSIDGYSEHLREEYLEMGRSQLEEMLKLPDKDREMIRPETPRADIRELKHFNKTEPAAGVADDIRQLIIKFYEEHPDALNGCFTEETIERKTETVNPRGTETFRKGMYFMIMYEDNIKIKKFGSDPTTLSWTEFFDITKEIFEEAADGPNTWKNYFGGEEVAERNADSGTDTKGGCGTNQEKIEGTDSGRREKPKNEVRRIAETNSENDTMPKQQCKKESTSQKNQKKPWPPMRQNRKKRKLRRRKK